MANKRSGELSRSVLIIGLFTLLAVGSWVIFDLYRSLVKTTLPKDIQSQMIPLETNVDEKIVDNLKGRTQYDDSALAAVQTIPLEVPSVTPSVAPVATKSASLLTPTPEASIAGEIKL